jgi:hypothetical protein
VEFPKEITKQETIVPGKLYLFNDMLILAKAVTYKGSLKYQILHLINLKAKHSLNSEGGKKIKIQTNLFLKMSQKIEIFFEFRYNFENHNRVWG